MQKGIYQEYIQKDIPQILKELQTSNQGLTQKEAELRLKKQGKNELAIKGISAAKIFLRQFQSPFIYLLILAGTISIFLRQYIDSTVIFAFLLATGSLDFIQEYRSEKTIEKLRSFITSPAKVKRDGKIFGLKKSEIVIGDLILLEAGDMTPADIRIIEATNLLVNESILTGESREIIKQAEIITNKYAEPYQAKNIIFAGTKIITGKTWGIVIATSGKTEIGKIANLTQETQKPSSFQTYILQLSRFLVKVVAITLIAVFLANLIIKQGKIDTWELMLFTVALAVSILPEALPVIATITLTRGAMRLAKKGVIVKRLGALEDFGNIDILCVDKTGTITKNTLTVDQILANDQNKFLFYSLAGSSICQEKVHEYHYSFEEALWRQTNPRQKKSLMTIEPIFEQPFDPTRRLSSVIIKWQNNYYLIVKGAPEAILKLSRYQLVNKKTIALKLLPAKKILNQAAMAGENGKRVFAVAIKQLTDSSNTYDRRMERGLTYLGMATLTDPLKPEAIVAINQAKNLGVTIKILTGDSFEVATTIARKIGLIDNDKQVIRGTALDKMSHSLFEKTINEAHVFSRVTPEQKYKIISVLQQKHIVGFLGDGINDAPALKLAHVGIVVNSGADTAKEAGDIVLMRKDLKVIIEAIAEGRKIFANIAKYMKTTLIGNFGNFYSLAAISLIINYLPMLPVQILLVNFLCDLPLLAIALDSVDAIELKKPQKHNLKSLAFIAICLGLLSSVFDFIFFGYFHNLPAPQLRTLWFIESVFSELIILISIRSHLPFFKAASPSKVMVGLLLFAGAIGLALPFSPWAYLFQFTTPLWSQIGIIGLILGSYFVSNEIIKAIYYRNEESRMKN